MLEEHAAHLGMRPLLMREAISMQPTSACMREAISMQPTSACGQYQAARVASGGAGIRGGRGAGDDAVVAAHDGADDDGAGDDAVVGAHDSASGSGSGR